MAFTKLEYKKVWTNSGDFPTYEGSEVQVRADMQYHPDAVKEFINGTLIPEITAENIPFGEAETVQGAVEAVQKQLGEAVMGQVPDGSITLEKLTPEALESLASQEALTETEEKLERALTETEEKLEEEIGENRAESWKVGDVRHSARRDLGDKWLLCNGESVNGAEYPELDGFLYRTVGSALDVSDCGDEVGANIVLYGAASDGEALVAAGGTGNAGTPLVYAANHPDHTWTRIELEGTGYVRRVVHENGKWALCGSCLYTKLTTSDYRSDLVIWHTEDPYGPWERTVVATLPNSSNKYDDYISDLAYGDGVWIATPSVGSSNTTGTGVWVYMAEELSGPWRRVEVDMAYTSSCQLKGAAYHEGRWVVCGSSGYTYYSDDPEKVWVKTSIAGASTAVTGFDAAWGGGRWLLCAGAAVYETTDPAAGWTKRTAGDKTLNGLCYDEESGVWVTCGVSALLWSTNGTGWNSVTIEGTLYGAARCRGVWAVVGGSSNAEAFTFETPGDTPVTRLFHGGNSTESPYNINNGGAMACHEGVCVGALTLGGISGGAPFRVARPPKGPWGLNFAGLGARTNTLSIYDVRYAEGLWVAVGGTNVSSGYPVVWTAEDPFGAWTWTQVSTTVQSCLTGVTYHKGLWTACGGNGYVWCAADPAGTWTPYQITGTANGTYNLVDIEAHDGVWAAVSASGLWTTADPETTGWTERTAPHTSGITHLVCADGLWAAGLKTDINKLGTSTSYVAVRTTEDITAGWSGVTYTGDTGTLKGLCRGEDCWWAVVKNSGVKLYRTGDPATEDWTLEGEETSFTPLGFAAEGREGAVVGYNAVSSTTSTTWTHRAGSLCRKLPAISPEGCYAYIRGKE